MLPNEDILDARFDCCLQLPACSHHGDVCRCVCGRIARAVGGIHGQQTATMTGRCLCTRRYRSLRREAKAILAYLKRSSLSFVFGCVSVGGWMSRIWHFPVHSFITHGHFTIRTDNRSAPHKISGVGIKSKGKRRILKERTACNCPLSDRGCHRAVHALKLQHTAMDARSAVALASPRLLGLPLPVPIPNCILFRSWAVRLISGCVEDFTAAYEDPCAGMPLG